LSLLISATVVVSVQATGIVLASALLVVPAASASFLSKSFVGRLGFGALYGALAGATGAFLSTRFDQLPTGPTIILSAIGYLLVTLIFSPERGWLARAVRRSRLSRRHQEEDLLKAIYLEEERQSEKSPVPYELIRKLWTQTTPFERVFERCRRRGWVLEQGEAVLLTEEGRGKALHVVRNHRIWELYLVRKLDFALDHVHDDAEEVEHILTPEIVHRIEESLGSPLHDPHGRLIPSLKDLKNFEVPGY
jgi:manganese/zinc/iron transport system permease protein